ncbi:MAG: hypothetical protein IJT94_00865 [Oscillibacter sp.]|nr:hypothetical protein [Oscillibacter sp.]
METQEREEKHETLLYGLDTSGRVSAITVNGLLFRDVLSRGFVKKKRPLPGNVRQAAKESDSILPSEGNNVPNRNFRNQSGEVPL